MLVDELVRNGLRDVVLAPGSRNAPLSFALHAARGKLRLHVRIDERSAGFLALGLAARSGRPVAVVCTSGTAAANLHPAVCEAFHGGIPLLVLTADRPPDARAAGANQTIDQHRLYGEVRLFHDMAVAQNRPGENAYWRGQICRAWRAARGDGRGGPAHLNLPFREPLVPDTSEDAEPWCESLEGRPDGGPWTDIADDGRKPSVLHGATARHGLVLLAEQDTGAVAEWAQRAGWPVLSEAGGVGLAGPAISAGMWLLDLPEFMRSHTPDQVLCVGRPTVFRQVQTLLGNDTEVLLAHGGRPDWPAPGHAPREVADTVGEPPGHPDPAWREAWQQADHKAAAALHAALDLEVWPNGPAVARDVVDTVPEGSLLVVGASNPARDVALAARQRADVTLLRNRGVAGIDGTVSTAIGSALAHGGPAYALMGDLTFVHDSNGLVLGPGEAVPDLTIVVFNDDGGGIFSLLEQGQAEFRDPFDTVFGTPHGTDLGRLCAAHGIPHERVTRRKDLLAALRERGGLRVVEVVADRTGLRDRYDRLRSAVRAAVAG